MSACRPNSDACSDACYTLAVALLLQMVWGKRLPLLQLQDKPALASEVVFAVTQAADHTERSRVARQFEVP